MRPARKARPLSKEEEEEVNQASFSLKMPPFPEEKKTYKCESVMRTEIGSIEYILTPDMAFGILKGEKKQMFIFYNEIAKIYEISFLKVEHSWPGGAVEITYGFNPT